MKKLNKKGSTLLELIISIALISIILVFLTRLVVDLNNSQTNNEYAKNNQINRAEIIRAIESDLKVNVITNISSTSSAANKLIITFTFKDGGTGVITATSDKLTYKSSEGNARTWTMNGGTIYTSTAKVYYNKDSVERIYTLQIDIEIHTTNDKNKIGNNNLLDDILISYIGKCSDYNSNITCLGKGC